MIQNPFFNSLPSLCPGSLIVFHTALSLSGPRSCRWCCSPSTWYSSRFFQTINMPLNFALLHIPPLFVATAMTFGGLIPFFSAEFAILEFGLPSHVAISKPAQSIMIVSSARITAIGMAVFTFYFRGQFEAVDTILLILGYVGLVDGYVCWLEDVSRKAIFRVLSGVAIASWGWFGLTATY